MNIHELIESYLSGKLTTGDTALRLRQLLLDAPVKNVVEIAEWYEIAKEKKWE